MEIKTINLGFVNCYLVKVSAGFILIDTGVPAQRPKLEKELENAGCKPENLKLIVLTHGDIDHTGNGAYLRAKYSSKIAMHRNDSTMAENGEMLSNRKVKSVMMRIMQGMMSHSSGFKKMIAEFERFKPDVYVEDGQSLSGYGFDAKVLHIPGHTKGSIGILTGDGDLISGDTITGRKGKPHASIIISNEAELARSIERLQKINLKTVYPGHGIPFLVNGFLKL